MTAPTAGPATPTLERVTARGGGEGGTVTNVSEWGQGGHCDKRG